MKVPDTNEEIFAFVHNADWCASRISNAVIFDETYVRQNIFKMNDTEYGEFYQTFTTGFGPYVNDFKKHEIILNKLISKHPDYPNLVPLQEKIIHALLTLNRIIDILEDERMKRK
jgi:hypothetical protein